MRRLVCATSVLAACVLAPSLASGFELRHAPDGKEVRWGSSSVAFVIDPTVESGVKGGSAAVADAIAAWSQTGGGPSLSSTVGPGGAQPTYDGQNSIILMKDFEPAGHALAVTVSTIDDSTGDLVDTDIVINGAHRFSVLPAGATDPGATPMANEGAGGDEVVRDAFDLQHVAAHEVGHALGLADVQGDSSVLMYAMTAPGSAANRAPTSDDVAGIETLYPAGTTQAASQSGCGQASVVGTHAHAGDAWAAFVALAGAGAWFGSRRRNRLALAGLPVALALAVAPDAASLTIASVVVPLTPPMAATARVASTTVQEISGVLRTSVELVALSCDGRCPEHPHALVWGGRRAGITQRLDGATVPRAGDTVDISYLPGRDEVVVLHVRPS